MIERYTRPEIGAVWTDQTKFDTWLEVELAVCQVLADRGVIPAEDNAKIQERAKFTVQEVLDREKVTDHDMAAFIDVVAASIGEEGRWLHYGLTSSDVLDTALALQIQRSAKPLLDECAKLVNTLIAAARTHKNTLCMGRTHGVHAEPTTFGIKLAGFAFESHRNYLRLENAFNQLAVGAISGAVGTYSASGPEIEEAVLNKLGLIREDISTQVVARDRHSVLLARIGIAAAGLERFATEIRHLQRTEVREVEEPFRAGQKGSSAMPHKRNPILCERITGLARICRSNSQAGLENIALWHERDISHSSVERVIIPDSLIVLDYMLSLSVRVAEGMTVHPDRMLANIEATHGAVFSQRALLALVDAGLSRDDSYRIVQKTAQEAWDTGTHFRELLASEVSGRVELDLDNIFDPSAYVQHADELVGRLDSLPPLYHATD